jgi:hypothetical protein
LSHAEGGAARDEIDIAAVGETAGDQFPYRPLDRIALRERLILADQGQHQLGLGRLGGVLVYEEAQDRRFDLLVFIAGGRELLAGTILVVHGS